MPSSNTSSTSTDWNISNDIYDIVDTIDTLKSNYIEDENETTLALGIFGFLSDVEAKKIQTSTIMTGELGNEMFPTRANLTKNVLTHAIYTNIGDINAIPSHVTLNMGLALEDIDEYFDQETNEFILDSNCPIFVGDYEFHYDYDIMIRRTEINKGASLESRYTYVAEYLMQDDNGDPIINRLSSIVNPYLKQPFVIKLNGIYTLVFQATLHQYSIETTTDKIMSTSIVANKSYVFEFDNQIADFEVYLTDGDETVKLHPFLYGSIPESDTGDPDELYCWYLYINDSTVRITFDSKSYVPGLNTDIVIVAYTTLGAGGNVTYQRVNQTTQGFYTTISSDTYGYSQLNMYVVANSDATDGADRKSKEDLQALIPKAALSRGSITTETDVNNYFNLIDTDQNRLVLQKKVDNQLDRRWYAYFLIKDDMNNIIPTNTIKLQTNLTQGDYVIKSPDGRYVMPAGNIIRYDPKTNIGYFIDESEVPELYSDEYYNPDYYYYMLTYNIVLSRDPIYAAFYATTGAYDTYYAFRWVNNSAPLQFVANRVHYERNLLTDQSDYTINFKIAQSILNDFHMYSVQKIQERDENGKKIEETIKTINIKTILVLYRDGIPYRWTECNLIEDQIDKSNFIYPFTVSIETDNGYDDLNRIKINDLHVAGSANDINYGYFESTTKAELYILANFGNTYGNSPRYNLDTIAPGYSKWTVTNIYQIEGGIKFYENFSSVIDSKVDLVDEGTIYNISGVPVVGLHYMNEEDNADYFSDAIYDKKAYIDYCLTLLENSMNIDFKFFNTYGPSQTYITDKDEQGRQYIGHLDLSLRFKLSLKSTAEVDTKQNIINDIKAYIEDLYNIGDLHIPNLIAQITDDYSDRINFIEFVGYNTFDPSIQHINQLEIDDPHMVPEFLNVRNIIDPDTLELIPDIDITIVD